MGIEGKTGPTRAVGYFQTREEWKREFMPQFGKLKDAGRRYGVSARTVATWKQQGMPFIKLPSGAVLVSFAAVDEWLSKFAVSENEVERVVNDVMRDFNLKTAKRGAGGKGK
jgi:hypothetical protein